MATERVRGQAEVAASYSVCSDSKRKQSMLMYRTTMTSAICAAITFGLFCQAAAQPGKESAGSRNKQTVEKYMEGFRKSDHAAILACLTDDVEWVIPGLFHRTGKAAFDKEIENEAFVGSPTIKVTRLVEESGVVVAEGTVRSARKDGGVLTAVFCDVFEMRDGKIKRLTSYLMETKE